MTPQCIPEVIVEIVADIGNEVRKDVNVTNDVEHAAAEFGSGNSRKIAHDPKGITHIRKRIYHRRKRNPRNNIPKFNQI